MIMTVVCVMIIVYNYSYFHSSCLAAVCRFLCSGSSCRVFCNLSQPQLGVHNKSSHGGAAELSACPVERACPMGFKWTVKVSDFTSASLPLLPTSGSVCRLITIIRHVPL